MCTCLMMLACCNSSPPGMLVRDRHDALSDRDEEFRTHLGSIELDRKVRTIKSLFSILSH